MMGIAASRIGACGATVKEEMDRTRVQGFEGPRVQARSSARTLEPSDPRTRARTQSCSQNCAGECAMGGCRALEHRTRGVPVNATGDNDVRVLHPAIGLAGRVMFTLIFFL